MASNGTRRMAQTPQAETKKMRRRTRNLFRALYSMTLLIITYLSRWLALCHTLSADLHREPFSHLSQCVGCACAPFLCPGYLVRRAHPTATSTSKLGIRVWSFNFTAARLRSGRTG